MIKYLPAGSDADDLIKLLFPSVFIGAVSPYIYFYIYIYIINQLIDLK